MGNQLTCNSTGTTPGLNATTGAGSPAADVIDVSQTSSGYGISVTSSATSSAGVNISQTGGGSAIHADASTTGGFGVKATNSTGAGTALLAQNTTAAGSSTGNAVHALCAQSGGSAIWAQNTNGGNGMTAQNTNGGTAVSASTTDGSAYAVYATNGASSGNGTGVFASGYKYSVYGDSPGSASGYALYANGNAFVNSNLTVNNNLSVTNNFTAGTKNFLIDHPLDPENRLLAHSSVESPDRKNVYDGVAHADEHGEAVVTLPSYFEALNADFRYQLTPIGGAAPDLHVKVEVEDGLFVIAGAKPKQRVSWQVTGIRHDALAKHDPMIVEKEKSAEDRGLYLHPEAHGKPKEKRIGQADEAAPSPSPKFTSPSHVEVHDHDHVYGRRLAAE